jgi:hypothetical protein
MVVDKSGYKLATGAVDGKTVSSKVDGKTVASKQILFVIEAHSLIVVHPYFFEEDETGKYPTIVVQKFINALLSGQMLASSSP